MLKDFKAEILKCDVPTQSGRVYPRAVVEEALVALSDKPLFGEFEFTERVDPTVTLLTKTSHKLVEYWFQDNTLVGRFEILNTPAGELLSIIPQEYVYMSARGIGKLTTKDENEEVSDYRITAIDVKVKPITYSLESSK